MQGIQPTPHQGGKARDSLQTITLNQTRGDKAKAPSRTPVRSSATTIQNPNAGSATNAANSNGANLSVVASSGPERRYSTPRPANTLPHHLLAAGFVSPRAFGDTGSSRGRKRKSPSNANSNTSSAARQPRSNPKAGSKGPAAAANTNSSSSGKSRKGRSALSATATRRDAKAATGAGSKAAVLANPASASAMQVAAMSADLSSVYTTPTIHNISTITAAGPSPLGLQLKKTPSLLNMISRNLQSNSHGPSLQPAGRSRGNTAANKQADSSAGTNMDGKLKASTINATRLLIGDWQRICRYDGDVVFKCYYAKQKLVWEVLESGLKSKVEIQWAAITSLRAFLMEGQPSSLEVYLSKAPAFFKESNPQPRKHTLWHECKDFTNGEASACKKHSIFFPAGVLSKHLDKLLQCDSRLRSICQIVKGPRFDATTPVGPNTVTAHNNSSNSSGMRIDRHSSDVVNTTYSVAPYPPHLPSFHSRGSEGTKKRSKGSSSRGRGSQKVATKNSVKFSTTPGAELPRATSAATSDSTPSSSDCIDDDLMFGTLLGNAAFSFGKETSNDVMGSDFGRLSNLDIDDIDYSLEGLQFDTLLNGSANESSLTTTSDNRLKTTGSNNNLVAAGAHQQPQGDFVDGRPSLESALLFVPRVESQGAIVLQNDNDKMAMGSLPDFY